MYILCHENTNMSIFFHFSCTFIFNMILLLKIFMEVTLMEEKKNIEIINGDGTNLDISPAYDHLNGETPKPNDKRPKNIVIPKIITKKSDASTYTSNCCIGLGSSAVSIFQAFLV